MGKKKPRPRRSFTPEFKVEIVELCRRGDRSVSLIAKDFDLTETAVRLWVSQAETDAGERDGLTSSEREELAALRRENRRLREDVEVLKRATAFFASKSGCWRSVGVHGLSLFRFDGHHRCGGQAASAVSYSAGLR
ncbi:transposase [Streptomyces sp. NPDC003015]